VRQLDEALEHAEAHLRVVGDAHYFRRHPAADAIELVDDALDVRAVARVRVGRASSRRATSARSVARAQKSARTASAICRATSTGW
jgi:hypothetical protein